MNKKVYTSTLYNVEKEISYLNYKFFESTKHLGYNNVSGTSLHEYQVEYAYKINKLKYATMAAIHKIVPTIHQFINDIQK